MVVCEVWKVGDSCFRSGFLQVWSLGNLHQNLLYSYWDADSWTLFQDHHPQVSGTGEIYILNMHLRWFPWDIGFYFEITLDLHKSCKVSTECSHAPFTQLLLMLSSFLTIYFNYRNQEINIGKWLSTNYRLYSDFTSFSFFVIALWSNLGPHITCSCYICQVLPLQIIILHFTLQWTNPGSEGSQRINSNTGITLFQFRLKW